VPTDVAIVKTTTKDLRRSLGSAQAKKAPATATIAKRMADAGRGDTLKSRRDRAMVMLGFAGAFRKSEVVALIVEDLEFCDEGVHYHPQVEDRAGSQTIAILRGAGPFCPVKLAAGVARRRRHHFRLAVPADARGWQACRPADGQAYYDVVKQAIADIGLDTSKYGSHSTRSGWISTAAKDGASVEDERDQPPAS
jgi:hypothetical protein